MPKKGYKQSKEHRRKISERNIRMGTRPPVFRGHSEESKQKISKSISAYLTGRKRPNMTGPRSPLWRGGYQATLIANHNYRARKAGALGSHTLGEWETVKAQYGWVCRLCKKSEPKIKLTEDHIIPLSKGGSNNIENIQPLCGRCNSRKNNRDWAKVEIGLKQELGGLGDNS